MKKNFLKLFTIGAVAMLGFSSCSKEDSANVAALSLLDSKGGAIASNVITAAPGETVSGKIHFVGASDNTGKTIVIDNGIQSELDLTDDENYAKQITFDFPFSYTSQSATSMDVTVKVTTTGQSNATEFKFKIVFTNTKVSAEHSLGNQVNDRVRFWASSTDAEYTIADAKTNSALVDLGYVTRSSANGGNKIIAPNSQDATDIYTDDWDNAATKISSWATKNATLFKKATAVASGAITGVTDGYYDSLIASEKAAAEPNLGSIAITNGDVVFFKTAAGKYGFIVVSAATGAYTTSTQSGALTFKAYYQK